MPDILCLGEPMLEFNRQPDGNYLPGHGGDTSNVAVAAARQGASVGCITHVGEDAFGNSFMELWEREGIDVSTVRKVSDAPTGIYFVDHGAEGHEFSYYRAGSAASRMGPDDLPREALRKAKILHVSGISQAISETAADAVFEAARIVREAGGSVSYDANLRLKLWPIERARAVIHAAMAMCDIAFVGMEDARELTGLDDPEAIATFYRDLGPGIVALTLGAEGTLMAVADERRTMNVRPLTAVDATAAGDTFDGAFLSQLVLAKSPFDAARYANAAAALSTQGYGAVAPMPHREAVETYLAEMDAEQGEPA